MDNIEIEKKSISIGEESAAGEAISKGTAESQPASMPTPSPVSGSIPPVVPAEPQQQPVASTPQISMSPIDLSGQQEMPLQTISPDAGGKKKMIIIAIVVIAGLIAGTAGFFIWRAVNKPVEEVPVVEAPLVVPTLPTTTEQVVAPAPPEQDSVTVIEQGLNTFNAATLDAEVQSNLDAIGKSL